MANQYVNDYEKSVINYFNEIKNYKSFSLNEEKTLWEDYKKNNNIASRDKLFKANCKFVVNVAKAFKGRGVSLYDLIAEGNLGLLKAIDRYNPEHNVKIFSYGVWWIKQAMMEAIEKRNFIPSEELPTDKEIDDNQFDECDGSLNDTDDVLPEIFINEENDEASRTEEQQKIINDALKKVSKRDASLLLEYYGLNGKPKTLEEIGLKYNLTKERVRQINKKTLRKMRVEMLNNSITMDIYKR